MDDVVELWGQKQTQRAPVLTWQHTVSHEEVQTVQENGKEQVVRKQVEEVVSERRPPASTRVRAEMSLDQRLRGLVWFPLYNLRFDGQWGYVHERGPGKLRIDFQFPDAAGLYDDFRFIVNGEDRARALQPENGIVSFVLDVQPGDQLNLGVAYRTRGMEQWQYSPADGVANIENFDMELSTDFLDIDFPQSTLSPSTRQQSDDGWKLSWNFKQLVSGHGMGMVAPVPIQPGELASALSFSAPVSLLFFFLIIGLLAVLRGIDIHPINYLFLAAAFFAFHLLFAYSVDHLTVVNAFALSAAVSIFLVVSYLRLVVSARFAFVEAALAQLLYLVVFSLAHFWDGFTGLTVTVLSIITLFLLMQLTARLRWSEILTLRGGDAGRTFTPNRPAVSTAQAPS
jgi:inner membrane protein involved in colicin E2 resistance